MTPEPPSRPVPQASRPGRAVDEELLLAFLAHGEQQSKSPLVQAIYYGLRDRIRRGDFDTKSGD